MSDFQRNGVAKQHMGAGRRALGGGQFHGQVHYRSRFVVGSFLHQARIAAAGPGGLGLVNSAILAP